MALLQRFATTKILNSHRESIDLNELVSDVLVQSKPMWKDQMEAKGFVIQVSTSYSKTPKVLGEPGNLRSALYNIIKNSVEAMPNGGLLSIETGIHKSEIFVTITDTGEGMTEELAGKIFQPFFTTKGFSIGRGLGMSGVLSTMQEHKGNVVIEKTAPGEGTTIRLTFPFEMALTTETETNEVETTEQVTEVAIKPQLFKVLWVDDEPCIRDVALSYLEALGHSGKVVASGKEAISSLKTGDDEYDLVITDVGMPDMNGWELAHTIRQTFGKKFQIAVLTGWGTDAKKDQIAEGDIDFILGKPLTLSGLKDLLAKLNPIRS